MPDLTRDRTRWLFWAAVCLAVLTTLSVMVRAGYQPLLSLDRRLGRPPQGWTAGNALAQDLLRGVEVMFGNVPLAVLTVLLAVALLSRGHTRAALWAGGVMAGAGLTVHVLKLFFARERPVWPHPIDDLDSFSFPSGHASGIASAMGVAMVLTLVFVRARRMRRTLVTGYVALVVFVGADRVFLGAHNVSDVLAGYATGFLWVLLGLVVFHPAPRTRVLEDVAGPLPRTRKLAVVLNPIKVEDLPTFKALVARMAEDSGWSTPEWHLTNSDDPGRSMAEQAAVNGADLVLVCGGDGTVRTVCAELAGTGIPVGVIPAGTGNLLARNLGIPLYLQAAIDVALNGQDRAIDLVAVSGDGIEPDSHYMVMAGMGFDAAIMEGANDEIKAKIGWLAYFVSGFKQLRSPSIKVEISVDDAPFTKHKAITVVVGNVGYLTAGIPLLPDAAIDDGVLDVVLVSPRRFLSWLPLLWRVMSKGKRVDDALNRMTGKKVVVRATHETPRQLDGDPIGPGKEIVAECLHGRLLVRVPR